MVSLGAVPPPACETNFHPNAVATEIHRWISSEPMCRLVSAFGGTLPSAPVGELLKWLDVFSSEHWDFRKVGQVERDRVKPPEFTPAMAEVIVEAATLLHLVAADPPPHGAYDHLLILGGFGRACLQRTEYAARLIRDGAVVTPSVAALGSFRKLNKDEKALPGLATGSHEVDAMDRGVKIAFGFDDPVLRDSSGDGVEHQSWQVLTYRRAGSPDVNVLAAPSTEPALRRANTPDTYEFWARRVRLQPTDRILVVTSPIYIPFQHCDAMRMLAMRYRCGIDTIGFDPRQVSVALASGATNPDRYLQEIRSAIR